MTVARTAIVAAIVVTVLLIAWRAGLLALSDRQRLAAAIDRARDARYVVPLFVATYALGAAAGVPVTPFTIAGGALFGTTWGIVLNWAAEMMAALLAFGAARATGLRGRRMNETDGTTHRLEAAKATRTLFQLRLLPVAPFSLLNVGAALSGMRWRDFASATALGIVPITVIYTVLASALVAGVEGSGVRALTTAAISAVVLIGVSLLPVAVRTRRGTR
jgi:uncharacterized membrane protein YdjX (TVP38/TMEM64 family)